MAFTEESLEAYSDLVIRVGLNLRAGQRLLIIGPLANGGTSLEAAPLVRRIAVSAYRAGAPLVEVLWGDEELLLLRFQHAPRESFKEFSEWLPRTLLEHVQHDHAVLSVYANDPDHLKDQNPELITEVQQATSRAVRQFREQISRNQINWTVVAAAGARWAAKVFPDAPDGRQIDLLWDAIGRMCRLDQPDPIAAWETPPRQPRGAPRFPERQALHGAELHRSGHRRSRSVCPKDTPGSRDVRSASRGSSSRRICRPRKCSPSRTATMCRARVRSTKPLSYGGTLIEDFALRFERRARRRLDRRARRRRRCGG